MPRPLTNKIALSLEEAISKEYKYYYVNTPCKHGHIGMRYLRIIKTGKNAGSVVTYCIDCKNIATKQRNKRLEQDAELKAIKKTNARNYRKKYPWKVNAYCHRRKVDIKRATPLWADKKAIMNKYKEAYETSIKTGIKYSVDHIIPLKGKNVCGLHVETNLQVISLVDNKCKGNRII